MKLPWIVKYNQRFARKEIQISQWINFVVMPRRVEYFGAAAQLPPEELPTLSDVIRQAKYY